MVKESIYNNAKLVYIYITAYPAFEIDEPDLKKKLALFKSYAFSTLINNLGVHYWASESIVLTQQKLYGCNSSTITCDNIVGHLPIIT